MTLPSIAPPENNMYEIKGVIFLFMQTVKAALKTIGTVFVFFRFAIHNQRLELNPVDHK